MADEPEITSSGPGWRIERTPATVIARPHDMRTNLSRHWDGAATLWLSRLVGRPKYCVVVKGDGEIVREPCEIDEAKLALGTEVGVKAAISAFNREYRNRSAYAMTMEERTMQLATFRRLWTAASSFPALKVNRKVFETAWCHLTSLLDPVLLHSHQGMYHSPGLHLVVVRGGERAWLEWWETKDFRRFHVPHMTERHLSTLFAFLERALTRMRDQRGDEARQLALRVRRLEAEMLSRGSPPA